MTTPTPRRPPSSKLRTTRPRQSTCTSASAPTTSAGRENREIDCGTYRHIGIHAKQNAVGGNVFGLDRLARDLQTATQGCRRRLQCHWQFDGKARRALHVRITLATLADIGSGSLGGFRHVCDDLPSGSCRAPLQLSMCTFQGRDYTPASTKQSYGSHGTKAAKCQWYRDLGA